MSGLTNSSKSYWTRIIRARLKELRKIYMAENNIDVDAMVKARTYMLAKKTKTASIIDAYEEAKATQAAAEQAMKELRDSFSDKLRNRSDYRYRAVPSYSYFQDTAEKEIDAELIAKYPELATFAKNLEMVPMQIELTTTSARLREFLLRFLPTIGIDVPE